MPLFKHLNDVTMMRPKHLHKHLEISQSEKGKLH